MCVDDDDKASVWTDEEEHARWKSMTNDERFRHMASSHKRKMDWLWAATNTELEDDLTLAAQNENLEEDVKLLLREHELRHFSDPLPISIIN